MELLEALVVAAVGLVFGSFVTLASYRLPRGQDIVRKPSCCPNCQAKLRARDLWPLFSWLTSRGRCRHCKAPISIRYPLTELATMSAFLLVYNSYGFSPMAIVLMMMAVVLLVMIVVDIEHYIIPDEVHVALLPLGIAYHFIYASDPQAVFAGFALGATIGLVLHYGYRYLRKKEGLGFGDVKFFAVAGLWLGVTSMVPFMFYSGLLGVATGLLWRLLKRGEIFPFGPALAIALFLSAAFPEIPNLFWQIGYSFK